MLPRLQGRIALAPEQKAGMMRAMATMEALKADEVADLIVYVLTPPACVSINGVLIRATKQS